MTRIAVLGELDSKVRADLILKKDAVRTNEERISVDFGRIAPIVSPLDLDLAYIAASLFACENLQRNGKIQLNEWIRFVVREKTAWDTDNVKSLLQAIISFTLNEQPSIYFKGYKTKHKTQKKSGVPNVNFVCLFSGGTDSLCGIMNTLNMSKSVAGIFVSHDRLRRIVDGLMKNYLEPRGIVPYIVTIQRTGKELQQLRGFLYLSFGVILAKLSDTTNVVISETGPTMYLPEILPLDEVTLTTHPTLIKLSKLLFKELYGKNFKFYEPYENLTKAEALALCPVKEAIARTNSCITTRFANSSVPHCGKCFGCLVRRISALVAGVPDTQYAWDVLVKDIGEKVIGRQRNARIKQSNFHDLYAILRFARDILEDNLPDHTNFKIKQYGKDALFKRFALDVFSALFILYDKQRSGRNTFVKKFYRECKKDNIISKELLENRVAEVRGGKYRANFDYFV